MEKYRLRSRWCKMLSRCEDEDHLQYHDYGGRGISVCEEWHDFAIFYSWCIENGLEPHLQLDRIDVNRNYCPENCRFVSQKENARNKRNSKILTAFGESKSLAAWAEDERCEVSYATLNRRIGLDWTTEDALIIPINKKIRGPAVNAKQYTAFGETKTLNAWSHDSRCVVGKKTLVYRINSAKWDIERALTQPLGNNAGTAL